MAAVKRFEVARCLVLGNAGGNGCRREHADARSGRCFQTVLLRSWGTEYYCTCHPFALLIPPPAPLLLSPSPSVFCFLRAHCGGNGANGSLAHWLPLKWSGKAGLWEFIGTALFGKVFDLGVWPLLPVCFVIS